MSLIILLIVMLVASCAVETAPLSCDHPLRVLQPELFTHCSTCFYGSWSNWYGIGNTLSSSQCKSGYAYQVERTRQDNYGKCQKESQYEYQCEPTTNEKAKILIITLGLVEQQSISQVLLPARHRPNPIKGSLAGYWGWALKQRPSCPSSRICSNLRHSRSTLAEETPAIEEAVVSQLNEDIIPMPFDLNKELSHINRQKRQTTNPENKYVLYILDSSGSIGRINFKKMTNVVAQFSLFYCPGTKIAVMSYSSYVYKNYCFSCDQNNILTRYNAIKSIPFLNNMTASGDAVQCACDYMLNSPCGFPRAIGKNAPEVDVILITDGRSNRGKDVCTAANCWSSFYNINVFTIGIGNHVNYRELDCIKGDISNGGSLFNLKDFKELLTLLTDVKEESKSGKCQ